MTDSIFILDKSKTVVDILSNNGDSPKSPFFNDKYVQDLATGAETFEFTTVANDRTSKYAVAGNYVAFKYKNKFKMFQIIETTEEHEAALYKSCYCEIAGLELINSVVRAREIPSANVRQFFEIVLADTDWSLGIVDASLVLSSNIKIERPINVYSLIQQHLSTFNMEIEYRFEMSGNRVSGMYIDAYSSRGKDTGKRFEYGNNVSSVTRTEDISELCTALVGIGTNDIDFKSVEWKNDKPAIKPLNQDFIVDEEAHKRFNNNGSYIMGVFSANTESPHELLTLTWNELQRRKQPKLSYDINTEMLQGDDEEINIGDNVKVIDHEYTPALLLTARIGKLELSFTDHTKNKCVLTNFKEVKSGILSLDTIQAIIDGKFPIGSDQIQDGAVTTDKIGNQQITGTLIKADAIQAKHIEADSIETKHLRAGSITADKAIIADAAIGSAQIQQAAIDKGHIKDGAIDNAKIEDASINSAKIQDAAIGTAQIADAAITNAKIGTAAIGEANIQNASIVDAHIKNLNADKITAGDISSDRLTANVINAINASIGKIDADHITVDNIDAGAITSGTIDTGRLTASVINAINASIENATIDQAKIGELDAGKITTGELSAEVIKSNVIEAINASIGKINAEHIDVDSLSVENIDAGKITTGTLDAERIAASVMQAIELSAGKIHANNIDVGSIKVGTANITDAAIISAKIADAAITNAKIANLSVDNAKIKDIKADKITAGQLNTGLVQVGSLSGNLTIRDNTIQIKDNQSTPVVRVQLGEDATGDYGLIIKGRNNKILWDFTGATADGIQNDAITTDKIKNDQITSNKLVIDEIWASEGFIDNFGAMEINADMIKTGTISNELININGLVSFDSLSTDLQQSFIPARDPETNKITKTWINGAEIATGTLTGDQINTRGFKASDNLGNTTFNIDKDSGNVTMSGLVESSNFSNIEGNESGYQLTPQGQATLNKALVRGSVILPQAGITNAPNPSDYVDSKRQIRFWAGENYENRGNAPFIVYSDGKIKATEGEFGGTFTGKLEIGNIHIEDDTNSNGSIDIKNNDNSKTLVHLNEDNSYFKSNLSIGTNFVNFDSKTNLMDVKGEVVFANGSCSTKFNKTNTILETTDGEGTHKQFYWDGCYNFTSNGNQQNKSDFRFEKNNAASPVKVDIMGELYARDKITMNNNIAIVARQETGNSGFDYVVK